MEQRIYPHIETLTNKDQQALIRVMDGRVKKARRSA